MGVELAWSPGCDYSVLGQGKSPILSLGLILMMLAQMHGPAQGSVSAADSPALSHTVAL